MNALSKSLALDRQIAAGEFDRADAVERLVSAGVPRSEALRRVSILLGERVEELPDPATLPAGLGPFDARDAQG